MTFTAELIGLPINAVKRFLYICRKTILLYFKTYQEVKSCYTFGRYYVLTNVVSLCKLNVAISL